MCQQRRGKVRGMVPSLLHGPEAHRPVVPAGGEELAVGAEGQAVDAAFVPAQGAGGLAAVGVEHADFAPGDVAGDPASVRGPGDTEGPGALHRPGRLLAGDVPGAERVLVVVVPRP